MPPVVSNASTKSATLHARRWRRWLVFLLAGVGTLALGLIAIVAVTRPDQAAPVHFSADDTIDQIMLSTYGKYSDTKQAWMYVAENGLNYAVRVVHRAKMVDAEGHEELYFMASGSSVPPGNGAITGAFKVIPNPDKPDGTLMQISDPRHVLGDAALAPEDIHFEALSDKTYGWVVKEKHDWVRDGEGESVSETWNVVLVPKSDSIATVARFRAVKRNKLSIDCAAAETRYVNWKTQQAAYLEKAKAPAPPASAGQEGETDEDSPEYDEDNAPLRCNDATFSYRTGEVPEDGFVTFTVTGGGLIDGQQQPSKSWKLVFDHKSFVYRVPAELE